MARFKLKDIGTIITGNTPKTSDNRNYDSNDICFVKPSDIDDNELSDLCSSECYISEYARGKARIVPAQSVLVTCIGIIGKVGINSVDCAFNQQINAIIPNIEKCDCRYLAYAIQRERPKLQSIANAPVVPILNKSQFSDIEISLPPLAEQRKIAAVLDKVNNLIAKRRQQLDKLDELVKSRFVELFGSITEIVPLSHYIASLCAGKSLAAEEECPNKVLKTGAVTYDYFDPIQVKNLPMDYKPREEHRVKTGDVIISRMNTAELVGATAYVWDVPERVYLPDRLWKAEIKDTANPIFVWQVLIQNSTKESIRRIASGTSGSMKNISKSGLLGIRVVKVPIELQEQFSAFVEQTEKIELAIQKSLKKLEILKKALMQEYFK